MKRPHPGRQSAPLALISLTLTCLAATACVTEGRPDDCDASSVTRELTLADDRLTPQSPAVCRDQQVRLVIVSEQEGVLHLHGYELATTAAPEESVELAFTADRSGQFPLELHVAGGQEGIAIGILTVHER